MRIYNQIPELEEPLWTGSGRNDETPVGDTIDTAYFNLTIIRENNVELPFQTN